jgi:hypothetical protein
MEGVSDNDKRIVQAILELCATLDDASQRIAEATATALHELGEKLASHLKADA